MDKTIYGQAFRFACTGVVNTLAGMAVMFGLYNIFGCSYWVYGGQRPELFPEQEDNVRVQRKGAEKRYQIRSEHSGLLSGGLRGCKASGHGSHGGQSCEAA